MGRRATVRARRRAGPRGAATRRRAGGRASSTAEPVRPRRSIASRYSALRLGVVAGQRARPASWPRAHSVPPAAAAPPAARRGRAIPAGRRAAPPRRARPTPRTAAIPSAALAAAPRLLRGLRVATEAVVQHRRAYSAVVTAPSFRRDGRLGVVASMSCGGLPAAPGRDTRAVRRESAPLASVTSPDLFDQRLGAAQLARRDVSADDAVSAERQRGASAPVSRASSTCRAASACQHLVVPQSYRPWRRATASAARRGVLAARTCGRRASASAPGARPSVSARESVEQQVRRRAVRGRRGPLERPRARPRAGRRRRRAGPAYIAAHQRLEIGLAGQRGVERLEPPRALSSSAGASLRGSGECDLRAQQLDPGAPQLVERSGLSRGQQRSAASRAPACELGLGRGQRAAERAGPGRRSARPPAPGMPPRRPARRGPARGRPSARARRPPPRPAPAAAWARCQARRSGSTSGSVAAASAPWTSPPVVRRRRPVDRRPHQRMAEPHLCADLEQPGRLRRRGRVAPIPSRAAARQTSVGVADRLGRRQQHQAPRRLRQPPSRRR